MVILCSYSYYMVVGIVCLLVFLEERNHSDINSVAAQQHETWATLGFLRGVSTTKRSGRAFCTPQWIELMMEVIKGASPLARSKGSRSKALVQQVSWKLCTCTCTYAGVHSHPITCCALSCMYNSSQKYTYYSYCTCV